MKTMTTLCLVWVASCLQAHTLHQSTAEADYNAKAQKLEVSLTVFINDLELALMRHSEKLLSIDKTPAAEFDEHLLSYLSQHFVLSDALGQKTELHWVGREVETEKTDDPAVTLYFEMSASAPMANFTLQHTVFCDLFKDQINLLHLRRGEQKTELQFNTESATQRLR